MEGTSCNSSPANQPAMIRKPATRHQTLYAAGPRAMDVGDGEENDPDADPVRCVALGFAAEFGHRRCLAASIADKNSSTNAKK